MTNAALMAPRVITFPFRWHFAAGSRVILCQHCHRPIVAKPTTRIGSLYSKLEAHIRHAHSAQE